LPRALRNEVVLSLNLRTVRNISVFADCSEPFLIAVASSFKPQTFVPGDAIVTFDDLAQSCFVLLRGRAEIISANTTTVIGFMSDGDWFGELNLLSETTTGEGDSLNKYGYAVRCMTFCDVIILSRQ